MPQAGSVTYHAADAQPPVVVAVHQVPVLLSATLRENICWGADPAALPRVLEQCRLTDDLATMADGLDTVVGPRGVRLSGGQRQRIALARALLRDPALLVLDDFSSGLDAHTEAAILTELRRSGSTIVAASTRPAVLAAADQVVLIDDGRVVARGTLTDLIATQPLMAALWQQTAAHPTEKGDEL
jgi:ATP-binding cassette subfamily B protein